MRFVSAPAATHARSIALARSRAACWPRRAASVVGVVRKMRRISSLSSGLPGTMAQPRLARQRSPLHARPAEPGLRGPSSGPWHLKQWFARIGRPHRGCIAARRRRAGESPCMKRRRSATSKDQGSKRADIFTSGRIRTKGYVRSKMARRTTRARKRIDRDWRDGRGRGGRGRGTPSAGAPAGHARQPASPGRRGPEHGLTNYLNAPTAFKLFVSAGLRHALFSRLSSPAPRPTATA